MAGCVRPLAHAHPHELEFGRSLKRGAGLTGSVHRHKFAWAVTAGADGTRLTAGHGSVEFAPHGEFTGSNSDLLVVCTVVIMPAPKTAVRWRLRSTLVP